ncbi:hypothetical protein H0X32_00345 [Patescibacteria group bacterium]|nr:hypothetical protein [Patescibacteria group bacterium]
MMRKLLELRVLLAIIRLSKNPQGIDNVYFVTDALLKSATKEEQNKFTRLFFEYPSFKERYEEPRAPQWGWLLIATPIIALGVALSYTMITSLLSSSTGNDTQGEVLGINASVQSLASALPGIISGAIASFLSPDVLILLGAGFALFASVSIFLTKTLRLRSQHM